MNRKSLWVIFKLPLFKNVAIVSWSWLCVFLNLKIEFYLTCLMSTWLSSLAFCNYMSPIIYIAYFALLK